ncbi:MAG: hypothetical protein KJ622_09405 [Alphaproteobacteria bacterium]|nr:hypothetical protein [Alphaproteobacteria bacterium]
MLDVTATTSVPAEQPQQVGIPDRPDIRLRPPLAASPHAIIPQTIDLYPLSRPSFGAAHNFLYGWIMAFFGTLKVRNEKGSVGISPFFDLPAL